MVTAMSDVPFFLESRIRQALARVREVARLKGLVAAFELDLFEADHAVHDLLGPPRAPVDGDPGSAGTPAGKQRAQQLQAKLDALLARLEAAPNRGPVPGAGPVGRAGRVAPGKPRR